MGKIIKDFGGVGKRERGQMERVVKVWTPEENIKELEKGLLEWYNCLIVLEGLFIVVMV